MYQTKQTLTKKEALKILKQIHQKLFSLDNIKWEKLYTNYLKENIQEEKKHDCFRADSIQRGITISEAGMLFAVTQLADYLNGENPPDVKGYTYMRKSVFTAYSIYALYPEEVKKAFEGINLTDIINIDYAFMVETDNEANKLF